MKESLEIIGSYFLIVEFIVLLCLGFVGFIQGICLSQFFYLNERQFSILIYSPFLVIVAMGIGAIVIVIVGNI